MDVDEEHQCPVCLDNRNLVLLGCNHGLCPWCCRVIISTPHPFCPLCRAPMAEVRAAPYDPRYEPFPSGLLIDLKRRAHQVGQLNYSRPDDTADEAPRDIYRAEPEDAPLTPEQELALSSEAFPPYPPEIVREVNHVFNAYTPAQALLWTVPVVYNLIVNQVPALRRHMSLGQMMIHPDWREMMMGHLVIQRAEGRTTSVFADRVVPAAWVDLLSDDDVERYAGIAAQKAGTTLRALGINSLADKRAMLKRQRVDVLAA